MNKLTKNIANILDLKEEEYVFKIINEIEVVGSISKKNFISFEIFDGNHYFSNVRVDLDNRNKSSLILNKVGHYFQVTSWYVLEISSAIKVLTIKDIAPTQIAATAVAPNTANISLPTVLLHSKNSGYFNNRKVLHLNQLKITMTQCFSTQVVLKKIHTLCVYQKKTLTEQSLMNMDKC